MRDKALESIRVACDPVSHVSTKRSTGSRHAVRIDISQGNSLVTALHQIFKDPTSPVVAHTVTEVLSKGRATSGIRHHHHIALGRKHLTVPAVTHRVTP